MLRKTIQIETGNSRKTLSATEVIFSLFNDNAKKSVARTFTSPNKRRHVRNKEVWECCRCAGVETASEKAARLEHERITKEEQTRQQALDRSTRLQQKEEKRAGGGSGFSRVITVLVAVVLVIIAMGVWRDKNDKLVTERSELILDKDPTAASAAESPAQIQQPLQSEVDPPEKNPEASPHQNIALSGERFPETRLRKLDPEYAGNLSIGDLRYAINEMFARHGVIFKQQEIAEVFTNKGWYRPRPGLGFDQVEKNDFSDLEKFNLKILGEQRDLKLKRKSELSRQTSPAVTEGTLDAQKFEFIDGESNVREGPGTNYKIIRRPAKGEACSISSAKNGWLRVEFSDGVVGWAHEKNLKVVDHIKSQTNKQ